MATERTPHTTSGTDDASTQPATPRAITGTVQKPVVSGGSGASAMTGTAEHSSQSVAARGKSSTTPHRSQMRRFALWSRLIAGLLLVLFLGIIFSVQYAERDQIRHGVHAYGVDLSGMSSDEARQAL